MASSTQFNPRTGRFETTSGGTRRTARLQIEADGTYTQDSLGHTVTSLDGAGQSRAAQGPAIEYEEQLNRFRQEESRLRAIYASMHDPVTGEPKKGVSYNDVKRVETQLAAAMTEQLNIVEAAQRGIQKAHAEAIANDPSAEIRQEIAAQERAAELRRQDEINRRAELPTGLVIGRTVGNNGGNDSGNLPPAA